MNKLRLLSFDDLLLLKLLLDNMSLTSAASALATCDATAMGKSLSS